MLGMFKKQNSEPDLNSIQLKKLTKRLKYLEELYNNCEYSDDRTADIDSCIYMIEVTEQKISELLADAKGLTSQQRQEAILVKKRILEKFRGA